MLIVKACCAAALKQHGADEPERSGHGHVQRCRSDDEEQRQPQTQHRPADLVALSEGEECGGSNPSWRVGALALAFGLRTIEYYPRRVLHEPDPNTSNAAKTGRLIRRMLLKRWNREQIQQPSTRGPVTSLVALQQGAAVAGPNMTYCPLSLMIRGGKFSPDLVASADGGFTGLSQHGTDLTVAAAWLRQGWPSRGSCAAGR